LRPEAAAGVACGAKHCGELLVLAVNTNVVEEREVVWFDVQSRERCHRIGV
jgi:hypothetical protein